MIDSIYEHMQATMPEALYEDWTLAMTVLDSYGTELIYSDLTSLISDPRYDTQEKVDLTWRMVDTTATKLLADHGLSVEASAQEKIEVLYALQVIQKLADYSHLQKLLESQIEDEELVVAILSEHTALGEPRIREMVQDVAEGWSDGLRAYIDSLDLPEEEAGTTDSIRSLIRKYVSRDTAVISSGIRSGAQLTAYLGLFSSHIDEIKTDITALVKELVCIVLMSAEGQKDTKSAWEYAISLYVEDADSATRADIVYHQELQRYIDGRLMESPPV